MAHTLYQNFALQAKLEDLYTTKMDLNPFITTDYTLTAEAGDKITINTYTATGDVEDLAMGEGNSKDIEVGFTPATYTVGVTQGRLQYYDEQVNKDPKVIDVGVAGVVAKMTNDMTGKIITALDGGTAGTFSTFGFDAVIDGLSTLNLEDNSGLFMLTNVATANKFKKALKDDLKYVEDFSRTGYIGTIAGVPMYVTKAVGTADCFYIAHREAVTNFVKRGTEIEYERDANTRLNKYFMRKTQVIALTDATRAVKMTKAS